MASDEDFDFDLDLNDWQDVLLLAEEDEGDVQLRASQLSPPEGGCSDRDREGVLSAVYSLPKRYGEACLVLGQPHQNSSPQKNLSLHKETLEYAALCTGQASGSYVESFSKEPLPLQLGEVTNRFTVTAVSPSTVISAAHCQFMDRTCYIHAQSFRVTMEEGSNPWILRRNPKGNVKIAEAKNQLSLELAPLVDPMTGTPYFFGFSPLAYADINTWALQQESRDRRGSKGARGEKKVKVRGGEDALITEFKTYMLPASILFFKDKALTCAMTMFPDVDKLIKELDLLKEAEIEAERKEAAKRFFEKNAGIVLHHLARELSLIEKMDSQEQRKRMALQLKRDSALLAYGLLRQTWQGKSTGNCYCAVGHILGYNMTMIAHSMSTLIGASGSLLIPTAGSACHRNFIGVHAGYAPECELLNSLGIRVFQPDHNLATSCDNPDMVIHYWKHVISTICSPQELVREEETFQAFLHWIALHLRLILHSKGKIVDNDWSVRQAEWLEAALVYLTEESNSFELTHKAVMKIRHSPRILAQLEEIAKMKLPGDSTYRQFFHHIEKQHIRVKLDEWHLPFVCSSFKMLATVAAKLSADFREEEQIYMGMPFHEFGSCRLSKYGVELLGTEDTRLVQLAVDSGFTSLILPNRTSEKALNEVLLSIPRDKVQMLCHCAATHPGDVVASVEGSLGRMGVDSMDVLLLKPSPDMDIRTMMAEAMNEVDSGRVKFVGLVSPSSVEEIVIAHEVFPLSVVQINLSNGITASVSEIRSKCQELGVGVLSTDLWEGCAPDASTMAEMNLLWKVESGVVPFTTIQNGEELSKLKHVERNRLFLRVLQMKK